MNTPLFPSMLARLLLLVALAGCSAETSLPGTEVPVPTPLPRCTVDQDCPDAALFICNTALSQCEPACRTREDCGAARRGQYALADCEANALGCQCDVNRCVASLCSADADCPKGALCRDGVCAAPPEALVVASCRVVPDVLIGHAGEAVRFEVLGRDAQGQPLVDPAGATWAALGAAVAGGGKGGGATFTLGEPGAEVEAVQARVGGATCRARVTVLPAEVPAGQVLAVVTDELTGRPIPGAVVEVFSADGVHQGKADTDAGGVARVAAQGEVIVSAFHTDFGYLTVAGYDTTTGTRRIALALRRNPSDRYGGYKGTFRGLPASTNLHAGLAGLSIPGLATDLTDAQLAGPSNPVRFSLLGQAREAEVPAGLYATLGSDLIQTQVAAQGVAGVCDAGLSGIDSPEAAIQAGACGTRTAWALAGDVPISELPPALFGGSPDLTQVLAQSIPLLRRFHSSVVRDVQFRLKPTPGIPVGAPDYGDVSDFTPLDHDFQRMRLGFQFAVSVPALPRYRGAYLDTALVLGAANVPGQGLVPLGLGMAVNAAPADPNTDIQAGLPAPGLVSVRMAPTHHGLEGSPYRLLVLADSNAALSDSTAGAARSGLVERIPGDRLTFDPRGTSPVALPGAFLPIPEGARYNFDSQPARGLAPRQFRLQGESDLSGATLLRVVFTHRTGRRWVVLVDPAKARAGFLLPVPPLPFEDRTYWGDSGGSRSRMLVQALTLRAPEGLAMGSAAVVESRDSIERLTERIHAFSVLDYGRPEVTWVVPGSEGLRVAPGIPLRVRTSAFKLGSGFADDGHVRLTFAGGTGCEGASVRGEVDVSQGRGEVELYPPSGCKGSDIQLTATLVDPSGVPLRPPVTATRYVNIVP
ncbi:carboxypeptidase regulatory-like domain-containing protein [Myxococcaceae bacterium GXIMD 01537]